MPKLVTAMPASDDTWDDVYKELGIEPPASKAKPEPAFPAPSPEPASWPEDDSPQPEWDESGPSEGGDDDAVVEPLASDDEETDLGDEADLTGDSGPGEGGDEAEEPTGPERKRRRRRRRRRRGSGSSSPATLTPAAPPETDASTDAPYDADDLDTDWSASSPPDAAPSETLRELIANWNVPSWDEIIAGLYRPER